MKILGVVSCVLFATIGAASAKEGPPENECRNPKPECQVESQCLLRASECRVIDMQVELITTSYLKAVARFNHQIRNSHVCVLYNGGLSHFQTTTLESSDHGGFFQLATAVNEVSEAPKEAIDAVKAEALSRCRSERQLLLEYYPACE